MTVQDQKAAPKVRRVPAKQEQQQNAEPEETAPVAKAVTLDEVQASSDTEVSNVETVEFEDDEEEEEDRLLPSTVDDDDDDSDLSLLEPDPAQAKTPIVAADDDEPEEGFLEVFSENCLQCKSLVPFATKKFKGCHFSAGNKHCPASETQVVIRVPLEEIVPRFIAAERDANFHRLAKLNAKLAEKPEWFQQRVAQALKEARAKQN